MATKLRKVDERPGKGPPATIAFKRQTGVTVAKEFECERDGVVIRGADDEEMVANVERHIAEAHPDLAGKVSRQDIVAAATEA